jgi:hypothetical protein
LQERLELGSNRKILLSSSCIYVYLKYDFSQYLFPKCIAYSPNKGEMHMRNPIPSAWRTPLYLIGLSLLPFISSASRLISIGNQKAASDLSMSRFEGSWAMLVVHILSGSLFLLLAAFQFSPELRANYRLWHRLAGKIAIAAGVTSGASGMMLILAYPQGELATSILDLVRVGFAAALIIFIIAGLMAIRRGDVIGHRAWMIRAFALAVAGTTQALVIGIWLGAVGPLTPQSATFLITLGFALNIAFAEWRIQTLASSHLTAKAERTTL